MGVFRKIHTSYWQDALVLESTPEEKFFYLYLMTNTKTTQCGIYEIPLALIVFETGLEMEQVKSLIDTFIKNGRILHNEETQEIMMINWVKHNANKAPTVVSKVVSELKEVKNKDFVKKYIDLSNELGIKIKYADAGLDMVKSSRETNKTGAKTNDKKKDKQIHGKKTNATEGANNAIKGYGDLKLTKTEIEYLDVLKDIEDYPFNTKKDLKFMQLLQADYPTLDMVKAARAFSTYILDKPFKKNANHRSALRNSCRLHDEWGDCKKEYDKLNWGDDFNV